MSLDNLLLDEPGSDAARDLTASGEELHAPHLMASEVANALWRKARLGEIGRANARAALAWMTEMPVRWNDDEAVSADAVRLALALDHTVYDCVYLAHRIGAVMLTAAVSTEHGESVQTLARYAGTECQALPISLMSPQP